MNLPNVEADGKIYRIFISPVLLPDVTTKPIGTAILVEDITEEQIMARSKDEFFSITSHELRTPLTAIRGTGLGLYISRLLLEKMGGKLNLEHSEVGNGSSFSFIVPLSK